MNPKVALCAVTLAVAAASGDGHRHSCPFLKKVVPMGKSYVDVASNLLHTCATDCAAFASEFSKHGNFTMMGREATSSVEMEEMCNRHPLPQGSDTPKLKNVFPAFSTSDMLFEVEHGFKNELLHVHFCPKTKLITRADIFCARHPAPESVRKVGERFVKQIFEKNDCGVYAELVESQAVAEFHGNPSLLTKERKAVFENARIAQAACEENARKEKRVHTSNTVEVKSYYYHTPPQSDYVELTIVAERAVSVIFSPGVVRKNPIAVTLRLSAIGKIVGIHTYETEVLHLEKKFASTYGIHPTEVPEPKSSQSKEEAMVKTAPTEVMTKQGMSETSSKESIPAKSVSVLDALSGVSASVGLVSASWWPLLTFVLSVGMAQA